MRVIIYGAGAIGGVVGGNIARTGHEVILVGRPGNVKEINENGLRLVTPVATYTVRVPAVTGPGQIDFRPDDVVFLCVKGQNTEEALGDLQKVTEDIPVFCFQNGVRNEEIATGYFPRIYGVMVRVWAAYLRDGEVIARREPPGWFVMGRYPEATDKLAEDVATGLRSAGFRVAVRPDFTACKWGKLMLNLANSIGAITNATREVTQPIAEAARREAQGLLERAKVPWVSAEQLEREWSEAATPPSSTLESNALNSTWQSLARSVNTVESDFLNGEIVRLAKRIGASAPINEKLLQITMEMAANHEKPGKYTTEQLSEILSLKTP